MLLLNGYTVFVRDEEKGLDTESGDDYTIL